MAKGTCKVEGCDRPHRAHGYCKNHARRLKLYGDPIGTPPPPQRPVCSQGECDRKASRRGLCSMHYARWWKHGDPSVVAPLARASSGDEGRYKRIWVGHAHPLANKDGRALEHRVVLYEAIGPGEHPCHWCDATLSWDLRIPAPDALTADHVDGDIWNNRPENLVPACAGCNGGRAGVAHGEERRAEGFFGHRDPLPSFRAWLAERDAAVR